MGQRIFKVLLIGGALALGTPSFVQAQNHKNAFCPVMPGTPVKGKFFVDYEGRRIYFCCAPCRKAFKKNPKKYLKNLTPELPL